MPRDGIVRVAPTLAQLRDADRTIAGVAAANHGTYSIDLHLRHDRMASQRFAEAHVRRLEAIRRGSDAAERRADGLGVVGACALQKTGASSFELTKMGVRESARGLKAGEFLLAAMIARAQVMGADPLYLLTNKKCATAIHLYEKLGFVHDQAVMTQYGARYRRCDVAMLFVGEGR